MNTSKKSTIGLVVLGILVLGLCWRLYSVTKEHSVLCSFVHDFTTQADVFELNRATGLQNTTPSAIASALKNVTEFQIPDWSSGSVGQPGSTGSKLFAAAPQRTQYYVTHLQSMVERARAAATSDLISHLRKTTGKDLGNDPQKWIQEFATKPNAK